MAVQAAVAGEGDHGHDQLAGAAAGGAAAASLDTTRHLFTP